MPTVYISSAENFKFPSEELFFSEYRTQKLNTLKTEKDKKLSALSSLLLRYALLQRGICESETKYRVGKNGKPYFDTFDGLFFSLSHCDGFAAVVIDNAEAGIDIENADRVIDDRLIKRFFHPSEYEWSRGDNEKKLKLWTAKESIVKQSGEGFALGAKKVIIPQYESKIVLNNITIETYCDLNSVFSISKKSKNETIIEKIDAGALL